MEFDGCIEVRGEVTVCDEVGGFGARHFNLCTQDDAGQSHSAHSGPEEFPIGIVGGAVGLEVEDAAISDEQFH